MQVVKEKSGTKLLVKAEGRIDTVTGIEYGMQINDTLDDFEDIKELVLDFSQINYVSSIGLRVILELQQKMSVKGSMTLLNVQPEVMEVFKMTGFVNILSIENT